MIDRIALIEADIPFQASVAAMDAVEGYLGSTSFLQGLLRVMVSDWTDALGSGTATADLAKGLADEYAAILFGEKEGYGLLPGWNEAGGIDVFVASELGIPDTGRDAIENALVQLLMRATAIANYADEPDVLDEHWRWQVDAMFEEFANLFLGIPGEDPDGPEFGPDVPSEPLTEGWITINAGDDDEGGQRVYIDGSGVMQTGHFKGQTMDQAFGKGKANAKRDADQSSPAKPATPDPKPAAGDGAPKLAKPAAFGSMMGGPAKSVNTSLNEMPSSIDAGGVGLMFDIVGANEHDELAKAIKTVRPDMASAVDAEIADRKASAEKWAKAKAENDDLMSVHPSLAKPGDLNKAKVKAAFKDVAPDQHDKLIKAISAARPDLADHAAASKPKAKAAKVDPMHAPADSKDLNYSLAHHEANKAYDAWSSEYADLVDDFASSDKSEPAALQAFVSSEFTQMNADSNHPASKQLKKMIDRLPDYKPPSGKIHRVLGFEDDAAAQSYVAKLQAGTPQEKTFSSWTHDDPTVPGASPMNNIGLDVASQFGDHAVILTYENPKGAKDISFAYFGGYEFPSSTGTEQLLQKGHKFKVTGVEKKGLKTYVKLSNP